MTLTIIAAIDPNNLIGKDNELPWYIPEDLKHFKKVTLNKTVIMGKNTYLSIKTRIGQPLPNRRNIVISSTLKDDTVEVYPSLTTAIQQLKTEEAFIIGGVRVFEEALQVADKMILTHIHQHYEGNVYFPKINVNQWHIIDEQPHELFTIKTYTRRNNEHATQ